MKIAENVNEANGVRFNGKHSFFDYHMFLSKRPDTGIPTPDIVMVEVPGANGALDYTEAVTGNVVYSNRPMVFDFVAFIEVDNQSAFKSRLLADIHGQLVDVELDEDAGYIYSGRATVRFENVEPEKLHVIIDVDAYPYKVEENDTVITLDASFTNATVGTEIELKRQRQTYGISQNSYFMLSGGGKPYANLSTSIFQLIEVSWNSLDGLDGFLYIKDSSGAYWQSNRLTRSAGAATIQIGSITNVDMSKISKITIENIPDCRVVVTNAFPGYKYIINNDDMPTVPLISKTSDKSLYLYLNNVQIEMGAVDTVAQSADFMLLPGPNELLLRPHIDTGANQTCTLRFRRGAL